jgi:GT2 family glycosyltransferase
MDAIAAQTFGIHLIEVLLVDGRSTDCTVDLAQRQALRHGLPLVVVDNPDRTAPAALNAGIRRARGEFIVRFDGHCRPDEDYIEKCVQMMNSDSSLGCVGGRLKTIGVGKSGESIALAQSSSFGVGNAEFRLSGSSAEVDTVAFGIYRTSLFKKVGGFDEELVRNQDDEFNLRIRQFGYRILALGTTECDYYSRSSIRKLWRQYNQYGRYKVAVYRKRRCMPTVRSLAPAALVGYLGLTLILKVLSNSILVDFALALIPTYVIVVLYKGFAAATAARPQVRGRFLVGLSALTMHFAYGFGFWRGLAEFGRPTRRDLRLSR